MHFNPTNTGSRGRGDFNLYANLFRETIATRLIFARAERVVALYFCVRADCVVTLRILRSLRSLQKTNHFLTTKKSAGGVGEPAKNGKEPGWFLCRRFTCTSVLFPATIVISSVITYNYYYNYSNILLCLQARNHPSRKTSRSTDKSWVFRKIVSPKWRTLPTTPSLK